MIRVNLLPYRQEARKARRQHFFVMAGLVAALGAVAVLMVSTVIGGYIATQESKNAFLVREIAVLDKEIEQIKRLQEQTKALIARKQIIEDLQRDRGETVHLLNELVTQVPEGIYLKSLKQEELKVTLTGYAQSNARISVLMRNLEASPKLENPQLIETKAVVLAGRRSNEFSMTVMITRERPDASGGKK